MNFIQVGEKTFYSKNASLSRISEIIKNTIQKFRNHFEIGEKQKDFIINWQIFKVIF